MRNLVPKLAEDRPAKDKYSYAHLHGLSNSIVLNMLQKLPGT